MPIKAVKIVQISDMNAYGFARAVVDVQMTPNLLGAHATISIDVPLQYTGDITVAELRENVRAQVIATLQDAASNVSLTPVPLLPSQPHDPPER